MCACDAAGNHHIPQSLKATIENMALAKVNQELMFAKDGLVIVIITVGEFPKHETG
jgi:hypothetical protein